MGLAFITTHYNPQGYTRVREKFARFKECLGNVPLFVAEISYNGTWETDAQFKIKGQENQVLWQKERVLNYLLERLPDKFDQVSWIDADMIPLGYRWLENIEIALCNYPVVQPFAKAHHLDCHGQISMTIPSSAYCGTLTKPPCYGCPGGWWAARRETVVGGLIDWHITGGGDWMQLEAWRGTWQQIVAQRSLTPAEQTLFFLQAKVHHERVKGKIGFCLGDLVHLFHGNLHQRHYLERYGWMSQFGFNPEQDIRIAANGLYEWTGAASPSLVAKVKEYFALRKEDG